jgi:hypothetical protein
MITALSRILLCRVQHQHWHPHLLLLLRMALGVSFHNGRFLLLFLLQKNTHTVALAMQVVDKGLISDEASPSVTEGWTICVECKTSPSNHRCRKCNAVVCNMCCNSRRAWWCGACFIKQSAPIQQAIRDLKYNSDDDVDQVD